MTESPLALICEFPRAVSQSVLREAHRLAWNFSLSPLLITVEPHIIRSFTCCQPPDDIDIDHYEVNNAIPRDDLSLSNEAARALHWVSLISGAFYQANEARFQRDRRADHQLLSNMKYVRKMLLSGEHRLEEDVCHDLLARVIFIQFLMDRKTGLGDPALDSAKLEELSGHATLGQVLRDKESAYELFKYLNQRFNGDLFAGNGPSDEGSGLLTEKVRVDQNHLALLAELVEGNLAMENGQMCLWKQYAFDVIPLEFISSIYEEFVTKRSKKEGAYYTPQHLVDYLLDGVLPWKHGSWDLKIMDPSCGSGVFLVKAFQRLVYRWRAAHDWQQPAPKLLRRLLEQNLFGVDSNPQAVKVASFSLYLAMCDYIEPADLWQRTSFPRLRDERIICSDFFAETAPGVRILEDAASYDLIIGNPPWGKGSLTELAAEWAKSKSWPTAQNNIGTLFLPKCAALTRANGVVSLMQPAMGLLFNLETPSQRFRKKLFNEFKVLEVTNLAAVRFHHFEESDAPVCILTMRPVGPSREPIMYICPKPEKNSYDKNLIIIEPQDVNLVFPDEAAEKAATWSALMWGGRRDLELVRSLHLATKYVRLSDAAEATHSTGIKRGNRSDKREEMVGRRILDNYKEIAGCFPYIKARHLSRNTEDRAERWRDPTAFTTPQLIMKLSWVAEDNRFRSFLVIPDVDREGVLVSESYVSVHTERNNLALLEVACITFNSILAVYYFYLLDGQCTAERHKLYVSNCLTLPLPEVRSGVLECIESLEDVDKFVREQFGFSEVEWALIQDLTKYTIPYYKSKADYPADRTERTKSRDSAIGLYADFFLKVLKAGFGLDKRLTCVAFTEEHNQPLLPVRLVAIYLDSPLDVEFRVEEMSSQKLYTRLAELHENLMVRGASFASGIFFQRIARVYDVTDINGRRVPTVYIIKPDQVRYWTRSMALRDADEVAAEIMTWFQKSDVLLPFQGATI
jgi:hypothetical protein